MGNGGPDVVIVGDGAVGLAEGAVEAVGARLRARPGWAAVADLAAEASGAILLVEAEGADADTLSAALPGIAAAAAAPGTQVVVVLGERQIDLVAAHLLGPDVQLLCHATPVERVAGLALAVRAAGAASPLSHWGENEAVRLAQVARLAEMLARIARDEPPLGDHAKVLDRELGYGAPPPDRDAPVDPQAIRRVIRARRLRDKQFGPGLFEDPAWDMLLDLYAAHHEARRVSVSSLCIAAAVAPTTALRWIARMVEAGLLVREPDPADRRRALMALTDRARAGMAAFHATLAAAGLPLV